MDAQCPGILFFPPAFMSQTVKRGDQAQDQSYQIYGCMEHDEGPAMKTFSAGLRV